MHSKKKFYKSKYLGEEEKVSEVVADCASLLFLLASQFIFSFANLLERLGTSVFHFCHLQMDNWFVILTSKVQI